MLSVHTKRREAEAAAPTSQQLSAAKRSAAAAQEVSGQKENKACGPRRKAVGSTRSGDLLENATEPDKSCTCRVKDTACYTRVQNKPRQTERIFKRGGQHTLKPILVGGSSCSIVTFVHAWHATRPRSRWRSIWLQTEKREKQLLLLSVQIPHVLPKLDLSLSAHLEVGSLRTLV